MNQQKIIVARISILASIFIITQGSIGARFANEAFSRAEMPQQLASSSAGQNPKEIFSNVEASLLNGSIGTIAPNLARQVYLNLSRGESGYFSSNQASFILTRYFEGRRVVQFRFSTFNTSVEPYATGGGIFVHKGNRETLQIYLALSRVGDRWVISQFNVY